MPYRLVIQLFDHRSSIAQRRTREPSQTLIGETATGLPRLLDHRIQQEQIIPLNKDIFSDLSQETSLPSAALNPSAEAFEPRLTSPLLDYKNLPYTPRRTKQLESIAPLFAPIRTLE